MSNDFIDFYSPIPNTHYDHFFKEVQYNGKILTEAERKELLSRLEETISEFSEGLPNLFEYLEESRNLYDEYHKIVNTLNSVTLFTISTMIDCLVAGKYFMLADGDYDRRFMRGKMMVILNEGFKRLYGFDEKTKKKSEWYRLLPIMRYFPDIIQFQYQKLTNLLKEQAYSSSWWREERNLETHLDTEELYRSRQVEIIESKVMMDSMKLFSTLLAINQFLSNVNQCLSNYLIIKYRRDEISR